MFVLHTELSIYHRRYWLDINEPVSCECNNHIKLSYQYDFVDFEQFHIEYCGRVLIPEAICTVVFCYNNNDVVTVDNYVMS